MEPRLKYELTKVCCEREKTSSSAIAERPRDACSTSNRKPVKIAFVKAEICRRERFLKRMGHFDRPF